MTLSLLCAGFVVAVVAFVFGMLKGVEPYQVGVATARSDPRVIEVLGEPIEEGLLLMGEISESDSAGSADLSIPMSGPEGSGRIHVVATKTGGEWEYEKMTFRSSGGGSIDLLRTDELPAESPPARAGDSP